MTDVPEVDEFQRDVLDQYGKFSYRYVKQDQWELPVDTNHEEFLYQKKISPFYKDDMQKNIILCKTDIYNQ